VIVLDVNVLLYAFSASAPQHARAAAWLEEQLSSAVLVGLPWATIMGFVRISTDPRAYAEPYRVEEAAAIVDGLLERSNVAALSPGSEHWRIFRELLARAQVQSRQVSDAHLAATAMEYEATLCTTDRDFARFPGLKWKNPLEV
jgi:toxin-antitoxin system PIN domain toxin